MFSRAQIAGPVPECDLIVKGAWNGEQRSALRLTDNSFQTDRAAETLSLQELKNLGAEAGNHLTFTCAPPNSGSRMGIDRDLDGVFDLD